VPRALPAPPRTGRPAGALHQFLSGRRATDVLSRVSCQKLSELTGQTVHRLEQGRSFGNVAPRRSPIAAPANSRSASTKRRLARHRAPLSTYYAKLPSILPSTSSTADHHSVVLAPPPYRATPPSRQDGAGTDQSGARSIPAVLRLASSGFGHDGSSLPGSSSSTWPSSTAQRALSRQRTGYAGSWAGQVDISLRQHPRLASGPDSRRRRRLASPAPSLQRSPSAPRFRRWPVPSRPYEVNSWAASRPRPACRRRWSKIVALTQSALGATTSRPPNLKQARRAVVDSQGRHCQLSAADGVRLAPVIKAFRLPGGLIANCNHCVRCAFPQGLRVEGGISMKPRGNHRDAIAALDDRSVPLAAGPHPCPQALRSPARCVQTTCGDIKEPFATTIGAHENGRQPRSKGRPTAGRNATTSPTAGGARAHHVTPQADTGRPCRFNWPVERRGINCRLSPAEISRRNLCSAGFYPLGPIPIIRKAAWVFPKFRSRKSEQEGRYLTRLRSRVRHSRPVPCPSFPPADVFVRAADLGRLSRASLYTIDNYYEMFNTRIPSQDIEGLRNCL